MRGLRRIDVSRAVFGTFFLLLLASAATIDRSDWPLIGDEATYRMQAESLAWDFDLRYGAEDHRRFVELHGIAPEGLILQSGDAGSSITFGKPFFYALYLSPWVRLFPVNGPFLANAFLLWWTAWLAARILRRRLGAQAFWWILLCVFGSAMFAQVFWVHADLFLASLTAAAFALLDLRGDDGEETNRSRWIVVGVLLAIVGYSRPMYLALLIPAFWTALRMPTVRRGPALARLAGAGVACILLTALAHQALADAWTSYGGTRRGFYQYTGFPEVDFPAHEWQNNLKEWGNHAWVDPTEVVEHKKVDASLSAWNSVYFLFGRHVGLLPYFLPLLVAAMGRPRLRSAAGVLAAAALMVAAFLWLRPFNFWGGGAALANRYFLPLYPMFWFLPREIGPRRLLGGVLVAGLFLQPLWLQPRAFPLRGPEGYRYVSPVAERLLPYETTQSHLKPGGEDIGHQGVWIKFLDRDAWSVREGEALRLRGRVEATRLLIGSRPPLDAVVIEAALPEGAKLEFAASVEELAARRAWTRYRVDLHRRARHPMWWDWNPYNLYVLEIRPRGATSQPIPLRLVPQVAQAEEEPAATDDDSGV